jgi:hypothetical protein
MYEDAASVEPAPDGATRPPAALETGQLPPLETEGRWSPRRSVAGTSPVQRLMQLP